MEPHDRESEFIMQKMMTQALSKKLPPLYAQDGKGSETVVYGHWFSCFSNFDFYATEYDPETKECFGFVFGPFPEMGYFSLAEFEEINRHYGFNFIERDVYFDPQKVTGIPKIAKRFSYLWEKEQN